MRGNAGRTTCRGAFVPSDEYGEAYRQALADYIRTCIDWKLPVLQTNLVDRQMLMEEKANKGTHPELIVRVCGFSAYFGQLAPDKQDEVIARADN